MRRILCFASPLWVGIAFVCATSGAVVPGARPIIAGFDDIAPQKVTDVLARFCKKNGCDVQFVTEDRPSHVWNLTVNNTTPITVGGGRYAPGYSHEYYVLAGGGVGYGFVTVARVQQLKHMLEANGAKVTLMDCSVKHTSHGSDYVCTNGKL